MPEIKLENIKKQWGDFVAVDNLNLVINDKDFVTLLGPSGCGKTTTLRMIAGLETPTEGKISIGGKVVFDSSTGVNVSPDKRDVGFLFQNYALWPHMTVYKNISFGLENMKWEKSAIDKKVKEMLKLLKIEEFAARYPSEISGGQQQRVAIARTLAPSPKVLFMDEPLSNLDAKLRSEMRTELKRLHIDTGATFVYVTHDQLEAMTLSTKICLMNSGVLQQFDAPLDIYNYPNNLFVADFVGNPTMNFVDVDLSEQNGNYYIDFLGIKGKLMPNDKVSIDSDHVVLGIRPEYVKICKEGKLETIAYSTLPSGLETTVKLSRNKQILSSVEFGSIDYRINEKINCDIIGNKICVFDNESKKLITMCSIEL